MFAFLKKVIGRFLSRFVRWLRVIRVAEGLTIKSVINLYLLSALTDSLLYAFSGTRQNPRLMFEGPCFSKVKRVGLTVVRGGTDKLTAMVPDERDVKTFIKSCLKRDWYLLT